MVLGYTPAVVNETRTGRDRVDQPECSPEKWNNYLRPFLREYAAVDSPINLNRTSSYSAEMYFLVYKRELSVLHL